jgi:hypothetical protein
MSMVYVDELFDTQPKRGWPYRRACHMTADTAEELHVFAASIGLQRAWAQHEGRMTLHYDLTPTKRTEALRRGATFVPAMEQARQQIATRREAQAQP